MAKVYKDLRSFLATLEKEGQLVRIKDEVMPEPDIASAGRAAANIKNGPAVLFEKVKGYKGRVVTNVHGSWANHADGTNIRYSQIYLKGRKRPARRM